VSARDPRTSAERAARRILARIAELHPAAWLVGGALRDQLLGAGAAGQPVDLDIAVSGDPGPLARQLRADTGMACFQLSDRFGAWRLSDADGLLQLDVMALRAETIEQDLAARDLTINAIALPVAAATQWPAYDPTDAIDPLGGRRDLVARVLRACGPGAFSDDPLRVLRAARSAAQGGWVLDGETVVLGRTAAPGLTAVAGERVGAEVLGVLLAADPLEGLRVAGLLGATAVVLPEVVALDGLEQSPYHDGDVGGHTREVLRRTVELETRLGDFVATDDALAVRAILGQPLAGGVSRGGALRIGALLHDIAKPRTQAVDERRGFIGFPGHDQLGATITGEILRRLRQPAQLISFVQSLARHHLHLGYLVQAAPLDEGAVYDYLAKCSPVEVEVTVLALADRLATRGRRAEEAIAGHAQLTRAMLPRAVEWREDGPPAPWLDGTELSELLDRPPGPWLATALAELRRARFTGELQGVAAARAWAQQRDRLWP